VKGEHLASAQAIPTKFLESILVDLRQAGIVQSRRGPDGGYWLLRPPGVRCIGGDLDRVDCVRRNGCAA